MCARPGHERALPGHRDGVREEQTGPRLEFWEKNRITNIAESTDTPALQHGGEESATQDGGMNRKCWGRRQVWVSVA